MITKMAVYWILLILKKKYRLIAADLSKQKALDADSRAIQQIIFTGKTDNTIRVYYNARIFQRSNKSFLININGWI